MNLTSSYPVLMVEDPGAVADFYIRHFGFEATFSEAWYVSLRHRERPASELAFVDASHPTIPAGHRAPSRGVLINLEVDDATREFERLSLGAGLTPVLDLRDEAFGQRHFIVEDPAGNLVDVIEEIAPSAEFAPSFADDRATRSRDAR